MADKPTVIIKVSGKKTGKNDKLSIDEKEHSTFWALVVSRAPCNPPGGA
jgi:hypothetical protein